MADSKKISLQTLAKRCVAFAQSRGSFKDWKFVFAAAVLLFLWLAAVVLVATRHEFWRDEVRALSMVRSAHSLPELFRFIRTEGHPMVWYLLLYIGKTIANTPVVLPVASIAVAFAAVTVFMFFSPFSFWLKGLFIFSALPFYEYSVMARNYGISMLLLFVVTALYRNRGKAPLLSAFVLALLANTNAHSTIFVGLIACLWIWDAAAGRKTAPVQPTLRASILPLAVIASGLLACYLTTVPGENSMLAADHSLNPGKLAGFIGQAVLHPEHPFYAILPSWLPLALGGMLLYLAAFGLLPRPGLLFSAIGSQVALGIFFFGIYYGAYRHQGLHLIFLLCLYWIAIDSKDPAPRAGMKRLVFNAGYAALAILVLGNVRLVPIRTDIHMEMSSGKAFAAFLKNSSTYRNAIVVPEPGYFVEALPYYADNSIYLPRERRFGATAFWTTDVDTGLSFNGLISVARDVQRRYGRPVLMVFGYWDKQWDSDKDAVRMLIPVKEFNSSIEDRYSVYAVH